VGRTDGKSCEGRKKRRNVGGRVLLGGANLKQKTAVKQVRIFVFEEGRNKISEKNGEEVPGR